MSQLQASLQELRERRFASDLEKLQHREKDLKRERERVRCALIDVRQAIRQLQEQG